jgi:DNA-binding protein HU-beta
VEKIVNLFLRNVQRHALENGKSVRLAKFGTFSQKKLAARTARNPTNGEPVEVPAKEKLGFKPSKAADEAAEAAE